MSDEQINNENVEQITQDQNGGHRVLKVNIEEEMKTAYIDYSMSVIVSRALPDVRDGMKPVHRRILYGMANELGLYSDKPFKKSARIVGDVMGKFHPHGDSSVYDAMVRMAQEWSMRYQLVDGQGNFGSVDGDSPAAMRYTEARMKKITDEVMADIDKQTVDFTLNFDDTVFEPTVLPTKIPLLLVNGTSGIAVGMATNMPPHNLNDTLSAVKAYIDNPDIEIEELIPIIKAPDFPTGGIIYGYEGVKDAYMTGKGRVVMRAKTEIEYTKSGRQCIIVKEIPYQVNKAEMIARIGEMINDKRIEGISYINDESDRKGMRIVIILKQDAIASVVLNNLYKHTAMQTSFSVNNIALVDGRPRALNLKQLIKYFVRHRHDVVYRRTQFDLKQAETRAHIVEGLLIAQDNIDEVIRLIRAAANTEEAKNSLIERFELSMEQATAIVEMRLRALTGLERHKLQDEWDELQKRITHYKELLSDEGLRMELIKNELSEIQQKYYDQRRTEIVLSSAEFNPEDFYADDEVVITISHLGYIKRTPLTEYRIQSRGGVGSKGSATRDEDFIEHLYVATMHNTMMFFTEQGKCYWLKVYDIPEGTKTSKGRAIQNVINIEPSDKVRAYINVKKLTDEEYINNNYIVMCTKEGLIKKTKLEAYSRPRTNGVIAINFREGDELIEAKLTSGNSQIVVASRGGKSVRFDESDARAIGRTASGVRGINLEEGDEVIGMLTVEPNSGKDIFVVTENGMGKRTDIEEYRLQNRGGKGIKALNVTDKTGKLVSIQLVSDEDDLIIINRSGITIRTKVSEIRQTGRATQGVKVIALRGDDSIASVIAVPRSEEDQEEEGVANVEGSTTENLENGAVESNSNAQEQENSTQE